MNAWLVWEMGRDRMGELAKDASRCNRRPRLGGSAGDGTGLLLTAGADPSSRPRLAEPYEPYEPYRPYRVRWARAERSSPWARASAWAGYRMIALGCRLVRANLVDGARANM